MDPTRPQNNLHENKKAVDMLQEASSKSWQRPIISHMIWRTQKSCPNRTNIFKTKAIWLHKYLQTTKDWIMELVKKHENNRKLYSVAKESRKYMRKLNIEEQEELNHELATTKAAKEMKQKANSQGLKNVKLTWEEKALYGNYPLRASNVSWVCSSGLKAEAEEFNLTA